jgi:hypothetical protein
MVGTAQILRLLVRELDFFIRLSVPLGAAARLHLTPV